MGGKVMHESTHMHLQHKLKEYILDAIVYNQSHIILTKEDLPQIETA